MVHNPSVNVNDMAVLVTDKSNPRYGQIGKMDYHDWNNSGEIGVIFSDGKLEKFYDDDNPQRIRSYYRHKDTNAMKFDAKGVGPSSFERDFLALSVGGLEKLSEECRKLFEQPQTPFPIKPSSKNSRKLHLGE